jgi:hypothetical protein
MKRRANFIDLTHQRFGRLYVLGDSGKRTASGAVLWSCVCACGKKKTVWGNSLRKGITKSCGSCSKIKHGMSRTKLYFTWQGIKRRTADLTNPDYGGRGIKISVRWTGKDGFITFAKDVGAKPSPDLSLDRINNDGDYAPGNVRWTTAKVQRANQRPRTADDDVAADAGFGA